MTISHSILSLPSVHSMLFQWNRLRYHAMWAPNVLHGLQHKYITVSSLPMRMLICTSLSRMIPRMYTGLYYMKSKLNTPIEIYYWHITGFRSSQEQAFLKLLLLVLFLLYISSSTRLVHFWRPDCVWSTPSRTLPFLALTIAVLWSNQTCSIEELRPR